MFLASSFFGAYHVLYLKLPDQFEGGLLPTFGVRQMVEKGNVMATPEKNDKAVPNGEGAPKVSRLVEKLTGESGPVVSVRGWLGHSNMDAKWRLYLSQDFDEYVEFDAADVVDSRPVTENVDLAGSVVWLRKGAVVQYTEISTRQIQADFLQGGITDGYLAGAAGASSQGFARFPSPTGVWCTRNYVCSTNPHIPACAPRTYRCGTLDWSGSCQSTGALCPTGAFIENC